MKKINSVSNSKLENWFREVFAVPDLAFIDVSEEDYMNEQGKLNQKTNFKIIINNKNPNVYTILKPASEICLDDLHYLKESIESHIVKYYPLRSKIYKFFGWWFIFAGAITFFSVCPICGQTGCPVGVGTTGILAGILSLIKTNGKNYFSSLKIFSKNKKNN